jgi:hypothetical protein
LNEKNIFEVYNEKLCRKLIETLKSLKCVSNLTPATSDEKLNEIVENKPKNFILNDNSFNSLDFTKVIKTDNLFSFYYNNDIKIEILKSDILETNCDAIVNFTNHKLLLIGEKDPIHDFSLIKNYTIQNFRNSWSKNKR